MHLRRCDLCRSHFLSTYLSRHSVIFSVLLLGVVGNDLYVILPPSCNQDFYEVRFLAVIFNILALKADLNLRVS